MRRFLLLLLLLSLFAVSCDDDDDENNNNINTNNLNCDCMVTIDSINGTPLDEVTSLVITGDDVDQEAAGFQIDVVASFSQEASCVPDNGAQATITGGVENMTATITGGQVTFSGYTIPMGGGTLRLRVSADSCESEATSIQLSGTPIPVCTIVGGVEDRGSYSCPDDDEVSGQLGLQRLILVQCENVAQDTELRFLTNGNVQATTQVAINGEASATVTLPVTSICADQVTVAITGEYGETTLSDYVVTGQACCLGEIPCTMEWTENTHYVTGTPAGVDTLNLSTDQDSAEGHQSRFTVTSEAGNVSRVAILIDDGSGSYTEACAQENPTANSIELDCTIPDGTVSIKPVCYTTEGGEINDASQTHSVYVDTVPPGCSTDFTCTAQDFHEVSIDCSWTLPGVAGTDEAIFDTIVKYTNTYSQETDCLADTYGLFDAGWNTLTDAPGRAGMQNTGNPGETRSHLFLPFLPGPGYCIAEKLVDRAGNPSQCSSISWTGPIYPNMVTSQGLSDQSQYGSSIATVDLNCDGLKDLVVGAPGGYIDQNGQFLEGDGHVYVYFAQSSGGFSATPDITMEHNPTYGTNTYMNFGSALAGIGNFTQHTSAQGDAVTCEDLAVGGSWMLNEDSMYTGEVYILKGRPDWTGITTLSSAPTDPNGFDLVVKYHRPSTEYADSYNFYEEFGSSLAPIGDFNGDGYGDIAIAAPGAMPSGAVYGLFSRPVPFKAGSAAPTYITAPAEMDFSLLGNSTLSLSAPYVTDYEFLGWSMSALGDINNDGNDDMIIGAPGCGGQWGYGSSGGTTNAPGKAFILLGGTGETIDSANYSGNRLYTITQDTGAIPGTQCFGWRVAGLGDFNNDGNLDFGITDKNYDRPGSTGNNNYEGALFVYFGNGNPANLTTADSGLKMRSEWETNVSDHFGTSLAPSVPTVNTPIGDFNNDGIPDILVGTLHFGAYYGSAFVWYGSGSYLPNTSPSSWITYEEATFWFTPPTPYGYWGVSVLWLGDTNSDGYTDIAIGDSVWDSFGGSSVNVRKGRVTVIY